MIIINAGVLLASSRRHICSGIHDRRRVKCEEFVHSQARDTETNTEAKRQFSDRNKESIMNVQCPYKWWSTLKSAVFASSSLLPPLDGGGGGLVNKSVGLKADLI